MRALAEAGTEVLEPLHAFRLELPADALGAALPALGRLGAVPARPPCAAGGRACWRARSRRACVHAFTQRVPGLTRGEGVLETAFARHAPVRGATPAWPRRLAPLSAARSAGSANCAGEEG